MYSKYIVLFCMLTSAFISSGATADPISSLITGYMKQREMREIKGKLAQIEKDLEGIKSDLNLIIDSDLKAAMSALNDAKEIVNLEEKADSIRSAKHFLTRAVNIAKEPDRKALAYYILGHVYLLLNEETAAKRQFKQVIQFKYGVTSGLWNKETLYNQTITRLKRDASGILCSYQESAKRLNENWCALHVGYLNASKIELGDLEGCLHTEEKASCERVGFNVLQQYLNENESAEVRGEAFKLNDPFNSEHNEAIEYSKNFLYESCDEAHSLSSPEHFRACYRRGQVLFHEGKFGDSLSHYKTVCNSWFNTLKASLEEGDSQHQIGQSACRLIYREPLWSMVSEEHKLGLVKDLCISGDLQACGQLISDYHFYDSKLLKTVSTYVADRCLLQEDQASCELIDRTRAQARDTKQFVLEELVVGLTPEGSLWDLTGDSNPEVLLQILVDDFTVYHQRLEISQIISDAAGNPITYILKLDPSKSILIDQEFAKERTIHVLITDIDPMSDDLIGKTEIKGGVRALQAPFGSVAKVHFRVKSAR